MLLSWKINNLGLFSEAELELGSGLQVITGESGAGKSMLIKSIDLIAGAKADSKLLLNEAAYIETEWGTDFIPEAIKDFISEDEAVILSRKITPGKKVASRSFVSGKAVSVDLLKESVDNWITFSGQMAAAELRKPTKQLEILDALVKVNQKDLLESVSSSYKEWRSALKELKELRELVLRGEQNIQFLRDEIEFYNSVAPLPGELEQLENEYNRLSNQEELNSSLAEANQIFTSEDGLLDKFSQAHHRISLSVEFNKDLNSLDQEMELAFETLQELSRSIADSREEDYSTERLQEVESRISDLNQLKIRFRQADFKEIEEHIAQSQEELHKLDSSDKELAAAEEKVERAEEKYNSLAAKLSKARKTAAKSLTADTNKFLKELHLREAKIKINILPKNPGLKGNDQIEILFQANQALPETTLGEGASGGELSRVNLALALAGVRSRDQVFLFDEIDAGIGGETAHSVGKLLKELSKTNQVIVISHLAQIAVHADKHFLIEKTAKEANIKKLDAKGKETELKRLMGVSKESEDATVAINELKEMAFS